MSTSKLEIYNDALLICGERRLASLSEDREPRHLLDHVWDSEGVKACLESGQWKFAMKTVRLDGDPDIEPEFGYRNAFAKPSDWCLTSAFCEDEYFNQPLLHYSDEAGYWYAELDEVYIKYVSDDSAYGSDLSLWTSRFSDYVSAYFASKIIWKLTSDEKKKKEVYAIRKDNLKLAKSIDAMADPTKYPAQGEWSKSRQGLRNSRRDRGNRGSLIG